MRKTAHMNEVNAEDIELYGAFFGGSADYYLEKLEKSKIDRKITFNPYALITGLFWFLYRKLWLEVAVIIVALVVLNVVEDYLYKHTFIGQYYENISRIVAIAANVAYGFIANPLYFRKTLKHVNYAKQTFPDQESRISYLRKAGGTSFAAVLFFILLAFGIIYIFYAINTR